MGHCYFPSSLRGEHNPPKWLFSERFRGPDKHHLQGRTFQRQGQHEQRPCGVSVAGGNKWGQGMGWGMS